MISKGQESRICKDQTSMMDVDQESNVGNNDEDCMICKHCKYMIGKISEI